MVQLYLPQTITIASVEALQPAHAQGCSSDDAEVDCSTVVVTAGQDHKGDALEPVDKAMLIIDPA